MMDSRRDAAAETARLAKVKRDSKMGGGSARVENGKVIVMGIPDIFARLKEEHEAKKRG